MDSSENEKQSTPKKEDPDLGEIKNEIASNKKSRSNSFLHNKKQRDVERNLVLLNKPLVPKHVKHKKERSENASEVSAEMNEGNIRIEFFL